MARATLTRNVVPGVHRLGHADVNCYLLVESDAVTVVDAAFPRTWPLLGKALTAIGRKPEDVRALVLTHAHFDHLGFARRIREEWEVPVLAHPAEESLARHPYSYAHENPRLLYPVRHPGGVPILGRMAAAGAFAVRGVEELGYYEPGATLDLPGHPRVLFTPGHTFGHCALALPDVSAVIAGDALVTLDPYTGFRGPRIVAGAATADSALALDSLGELAATGARVLLPGHGEPWRQGAEAAVASARAAGPS
ncbi:MBL fold metallo-hydrolase [Amnibacterium sp. CER49]|uniref:MBL fold metallo-hydrolase n=1 Tax=Amnibacterium sp. CER49 TaxID=3039161 RepID=UPI00244A9CEB|nr:MBL fold metallo-hydrolase [Amnibacterium sp. CER49]MDH2443742.1 MBL fold metallo-hydrolase [Amnibacterium sp. CER49]